MAQLPNSGTGPIFNNQGEQVGTMSLGGLSGNGLTITFGNATEQSYNWDGEGYVEPEINPTEDNPGTIPPGRVRRRRLYFWCGAQSPDGGCVVWKWKQQLETWVPGLPPHWEWLDSATQYGLAGPISG